jgi:cell division protein FtsZ
MEKIDNGKVYYPKISIIGIGGGGGSIVSEIAKKISKTKIPHLDKIKFIVANVDIQAIKQIPKQAKTFYFGKDFTMGLGCGMRPEIGEKSALKEKNRIAKLLQNNDICIFVSSLGGGTGSGASPVFAEIAKELGIKTFGMFTQPFSFEGQERKKIASNSLKNLKAKLDTYTIMPNQRIFKIVNKNTPVDRSLSSMNDMLVSMLEGLIETLYLPGLINLDFSDFKSVIESEKSLTYLHSEIFKGKDRSEKALKAIFNNPLISYNTNEADRILFNISGGKDLKMSEVAKICEKIGNINSKARIIFGIGQDNKYKNKIRITLMAVGCEKEIKKKPKKKMPNPEKKEERKEEKKEEKQEKIKIEKKPVEKSEEKLVKKIAEKTKPKGKEKKTKSKKQILKKKKIKKIKISPKINTKETIRHNALDLHKKAEEDMQKMIEEENKWDVPAFIREGNKGKNN